MTTDDTRAPDGTATDGSTSDGPAAGKPAMADPTDLRRGLDAGYRFRCDGCGNVTRFDVLATARTRRYHHFDLGGEGHVEEEEVLSHHVESVTCRWCGRDDAVQIEASPLARS